MSALITYLMPAAQLLTAVVLGALIGLERQRRQRMAGLRTNALVALGSAAFVMTGTMVSGELSPTRVAAQVVSGIGFLCAGVIMRDGFNVRGLNTAATLWCSAAVGVMAGLGFLVHSVLITGMVILAHLTLRPLSTWMDRQPGDDGTEIEAHYRLRIVCRLSEEAHIRALLMHMLSGSALSIRSLRSGGLEAEPNGGEHTRVLADLSGIGHQQALLERIVSRMSLEGVVSEVSWEQLERRDGARQGLFDERG